ncbi:MAG: hypothetical protein BGO98_31935 [Myxococcales bacterium 68-20]|nr:DUF2786 domain-containing protein [Myxococcales bacterium]OJY18358.1 MAG: hypothetical protein BGO98_31935 [Myxococcales bacterium 68-20]
MARRRDGYGKSVPQGQDLVGESSTPLNNVVPVWYLGQSMSSIDRIEKLIALAGSANEHEARSAAYLACKLIRDGGYRVVAKAADPWDEAFTASAWTAYATRAEPQARRRPAPDTRPRRRVPCEIGSAKRSGLCAVCAEPFEEGSDVAFPMLASDANLGVVHADCRTRWTVPIDP